MRAKLPSNPHSYIIDSAIECDSVSNGTAHSEARVNDTELIHYEGSAWYPYIFSVVGS